MRREVRAESARRGAGANKTGSSGADLIVRVPVGTIVRDAEDDPEAPPLADLAADGARCVVAQGGRGGRGNARFATATRQTPDFFEPGKPGEERTLHLSLKLLADVGLVGFPNAGKSTLLAPDLGGEAARGRLSVHHARAQPRRRRGRRAALRGGRPARSRRGREPRRRPRRPLPAPRRAHARADPPDRRRQRAARGRRSARALRPDPRRALRLRRRARAAPRARRAEQDRPGRRPRAARRRSRRALRARGREVFRVSGATGEGVARAARARARASLDEVDAEAAA